MGIHSKVPLQPQARQTHAPNPAESEPAAGEQAAAPVQGPGPNLLDIPTHSPSASPQAGRKGRVLPGSLRAKAESALGHEFSRIRLYESPEATRLGSQAFTRGEEIHLAPGRYAPGSSAGEQLIAHELVHVVQQRQGRVRGAGPDNPINQDAALEAEADGLSQRLLRGGPSHVPAEAASPQAAPLGAAASGASASAPIQRKVDPRVAHQQAMQQLRQQALHQQAMQQLQPEVMQRQRQRERHQRVMGELNEHATDIRKFSVAKALNKMPRVEHYKYTASQVDDMKAHTLKRYGKAMGRSRHSTLSALGQGYENLAVDAGLMSQSHFGKFMQFVTKAKRSGMDTSDPWKMREAYSKSQGRVEVYRGLKLGTDLGPPLAKQGLNPLLTRTLQGMATKPPEQTLEQRRKRTKRLAWPVMQALEQQRRAASAKKNKGPGPIKQLLSPEQTTLPPLGDTFDKPIQDIVQHRVDTYSRYRGRIPLPPKLDEKKYKEEKIQEWQTLKEQNPNSVKDYKNPTVYKNKMWGQYVSHYDAKNLEQQRRLNKEDVAQSVTFHEDIASGFGGSDLFGGGAPNENERIFSYKMNMSPVDVINPADYVPKKKMAQGVKVKGKEYANDEKLESLLLTPAQKDEMQSYEAYTKAQLPTFEVVDKDKAKKK